MYIGRGSRACALGAPKWANKYKSGLEGCRRAVVDKFEAAARERADLLGWLPDLSGMALAYQCHTHEPYHADALSRLWREMVGPSADDLGGATSEEDHVGDIKPKRGAGWWGTRSPLQIGHGARWRDLQYGGGLCSPGRWPPNRRRSPERGARVAAVLKDVLERSTALHPRCPMPGRYLAQLLVGELALGKTEVDPFRGIDR